jgi:hypothetical protein
VRAEDIVGSSFFALLIPAIVVTISGSRTTLTLRQRALWRGWGLGLISGVSLGFGLLSFQLIHNSPRPVVEGNLWNIQGQFRSGGTRFMVTDASGRAVLIRCGYRGPGLVQGERARVSYVAYNRKLAEMEMLSGPFKGWHLREATGEEGCWSWVAIGAVCGLFAFRQLAKARQGQSSAP